MRNWLKRCRGRATGFPAAAMLVALVLVAFGFYLQDALIPVNAAALSFSDVWGNLPGDSGGHGIMFGDVDGDGNPDLYVTLNQNLGAAPDLFFSNKGGGVFEEESEERGIEDSNDGGSHGAVWSDLDNDGDFDLLNGATLPPGLGGDETSLGENNDVYRNDGNGLFTRATPPAFLNNRKRTRAVLALDWDNDGDLDLFSINGSDEDDSPEAYRNNGNFNFTEITSGALVTSTGHQGATDTDYDGDGDVDIFMGNRNGRFGILKNDGSGSFTIVVPSSIGLPDGANVAGDGITTADVDNDGDLDILLTRDNGGDLYLNDGDGTFTFEQNFAGTDGYMGGFGDLDHDGDLDLVFAGDDLVYLNDGTGTFSSGPAVPTSGLRDPRAVAFADIDNDGDLDFAFAYKSSRNNMIRNNFDGGNWLKVALVSPHGQAGAFGARTRIYPAGQGESGPLLGLRESRSNYGYLGQDDPVLHFGLGSHNSVDVVVTFLDGTRVTRANVPANQRILISEQIVDSTPPALSNVTSLNATSVSVLFSEPVEQASAQSPANYSINLGVAVSSAALAADLRTVTLTTSAHALDTTYTITVNNVRDRAISPNTILPASQGSYVFDEADPDLISYWTFDEGSGTALEDTVGTNQGALVDMDATTAWVPGRQGTGLHFDGLNDSVAVSNFDPPHSGTVAFWMNPDVVPASGRQRIMGGHDAYELILEAGEIRSQLFAGGSQDVASTTQLSPNQWYHIAATYDFTFTHTLEIYINGVLEASNSFADDDPGGPFTLSFGTRTGSSEYYQGILDNVRLYDRVLTGAEVVQVMQEEVPKTDPLPAFQVEASFGLYQDASDGAAGLRVDISRAVDRSTGEDAQVLSGGFQFQLTYDGSCVNILDIRPSSFPGVSGSINNSVGMATFKDLDPSGVPLPAELGDVLTRLLGSASAKCAVAMTITGLVDDENSPIGVEPLSLTQELQRGDARADGEIGVADALYIAQHLTGLRPACATPLDVACLHSANAASARIDGDFDRISIHDARAIAELLTGRRSEEFNLKP